MLQRSIAQLTALDIKLSQTLLSIDIAQFPFRYGPKHA